jgi:hypothetical protein
MKFEAIQLTQSRSQLQQSSRDVVNPVRCFQRHRGKLTFPCHRRLNRDSKHFNPLEFQTFRDVPSRSKDCVSHQRCSDLVLGYLNTNGTNVRSTHNPAGKEGTAVIPIASCRCGSLTMIAEFRASAGKSTGSIRRNSQGDFRMPFPGRTDRSLPYPIVATT